MAIDEKKARYLRVKVVDTARGEGPVNIRVPIGVAKFGMRMAQAFSPEMKQADVDWDSISEMLDRGDLGEIVHVEDEAEHKTVDVWIE